MLRYALSWSTLCYSDSQTVIDASALHGWILGGLLATRNMSAVFVNRHPTFARRAKSAFKARGIVEGCAEYAEDI